MAYTVKTAARHYEEKKSEIFYSVDPVDVPMKELGEAWRPVSPFKFFPLAFSFNLSANN